MRIVGLVLAGALAASLEAPGHADPPGSNVTSLRPVPSVGQLNHSNPWGRHQMPDTRNAVRQPMPGQPRQWTGQTRPHWEPNRHSGSSGPHWAWGGPYTVWGGPYAPYVWGGPVPYRHYGDWGALDYPYSEWRGPTGGWGNP
jgi:hypothetical protein